MEQFIEQKIAMKLIGLHNLQHITNLSKHKSWRLMEKIHIFIFWKEVKSLLLNIDSDSDLYRETAARIAEVCWQVPSIS